MSTETTETPLANETTPLPAAEVVPEPAAETPAAQPVAAAPVTESVAEPAAEPEESFADLLQAFESTHKHRASDAPTQLTGTVLAVKEDRVLFDIGYKIEGAAPRSAFLKNADQVKPGDTFPVSIKGRNEEGYYELSLKRVSTPHDWEALQAAFDSKTPVIGTVTAVIKGGVSVDVGVRAFMPASRSGTRDAEELEKLVGQEVTVRITKLDVTDEDLVVDRRSVLEEEARGKAEARFETITVGDNLEGTVRSLVPYGAFIDLGGFDGLLHISDIAYNRIAKPEDVLAVGQQITVRVLKVDKENKKLSLGLKQLQPEPWEAVPEKYKAGQHVSGTVVRLTDFGAFVELEPGIEGLIHISEMAWGKHVQHPSEIVKVGERVETVILGIKPEERRIALGLKQTLADPWTEFEHQHGVGSHITGPVTKLMAFGAFVQIAEGVEGLVHISEIVADRRLNHPSEELHVGQVVEAQVLAIDSEKRQVKLSMKQLIPTSIDEYIAENKVGDKVSGRIVEASETLTLVELGEGIRATCRKTKAEKAAVSAEPKKPAAKADLSSLTSLLQARWKGQDQAAEAKSEPVAAGQIRTFRIVKLDADSKKIELELA